MTQSDQQDKGRDPMGRTDDFATGDTGIDPRTLVAEALMLRIDGLAAGHFAGNPRKMDYYRGTLRARIHTTVAKSSERLEALASATDQRVLKMLDKYAQEVADGDTEADASPSSDWQGSPAPAIVPLGGSSPAGAEAGGPILEGVPAGVAPAPPAAADLRYCTKCGHRNRESDNHCVKCGAPLHGAVNAARNQYVVVDSLQTLIPTGNPKALWSYYLGFASLVCCLPAAIAAVILGVMAIKHANLHPEAKGKAHAWTGIILGGLGLAAGLLVIVSMVIGSVASH